MESVNQVTHHFGDLMADLELLYDKVDGFYTILHQHMGTDGPLYCPKRHAGTIRECISVAMCLLQSAVPVHVPLYVYASYLEQVWFMLLSMFCYMLRLSLSLHCVKMSKHSKHERVG